MGIEGSQELREGCKSPLEAGNGEFLFRVYQVAVAALGFNQLSVWAQTVDKRDNDA